MEKDKADSVQESTRLTVKELNNFTNEAFDKLAKDINTNKTLEQSQDFLKYMGDFSNFSSRNLMLLLAQKDNLSNKNVGQFLTFEQWNKNHMQVYKGEKALNIIVPAIIPVHERDPITQEYILNEKSERIPVVDENGDAVSMQVFNIGKVFADTQTDCAKKSKIEPSSKTIYLDDESIARIFVELKNVAEKELNFTSKADNIKSFFNEFAKEIIEYGGEKTNEAKNFEAKILSIVLANKFGILLDKDDFKIDGFKEPITTKELINLFDSTKKAVEYSFYKLNQKEVATDSELNQEVRPKTNVNICTLSQAEAYENRKELRDLGVKWNQTEKVWYADSIEVFQKMEKFQNALSAGFTMTMNNQKHENMNEIVATTTNISYEEFAGEDYKDYEKISENENETVYRPKQKKQ